MLISDQLCGLPRPQQRAGHDNLQWNPGYCLGCCFYLPDTLLVQWKVLTTHPQIVSVVICLTMPNKVEQRNAAFG
jgi:hypothetical protein